MLNIPDAIKALYLADSRPDIRKNFSVHFPNGELPDINADQILTESVKFDESIMSRSTFKFGLAEAPQISFETVGVGNMMGMTIECGHEIETTSLSAADIAAIQAGTWDGELVLVADSDLGYGFFRIPLGTFIVDSCPRNHGAMTHRRVTATAPAISTDEGGAFSFEQWKAAQYFLFGQMKLNIAKWVYSVAGAEMFGVSVTPTTSGFTGAEDTRALITKQYGAQGRNGTLVLSVVIKTVNLAIDSVFFVDIPGMPSDFLDDYEDAWDTIATVVSGSDADKAEFDAAAQDVAAWGQSISEYSFVNARGYKWMGHAFSGSKYPLNPSNSGQKLYAYEQTADTDSTVYVQVPVALRLERIPGYASSFSADHVDLDTSSTAPTYTVYAFSGTAPSYTAQHTGEQGSPARYSYLDSFSFADMLSGAFEVNGLFALSGRNGGYSPVALDRSAPVTITPGQYSEMWFDEYDVLPIGTVNYDFVDSQGSSQSATYAFGNGLSVYEMTGNFIMQNIPHTVDDAQSLLDSYFIPNLPAIQFTPAEIDAQGMPWLEAGDAVDIVTEDSVTVETYILSRTLSGMQVLRDSFSANGGELIADAMGYGL